MTSPEKAWQRIAETTPYWGVYARDEFKAAELGAEARARFFASGEEHVAAIFRVVERFRPGFRPSHALDFGCGVGRVTIPLARRAARVSGVDVSPAMLAEARKNLAAAGVAERVDLGDSVHGPYDFVHSHHVFQHIPERRGLELTRRLVAALAPGGVGVLHYHYWRDASRMRKLVHWARSRVPLAHGVANLAQGKRWSDPLIMMEAYSLSRVLRVFAQAGVEAFYGETLAYRGSHSVLLYLWRSVPGEAVEKPPAARGAGLGPD